ncbi:hypothetical protein [Vibrio splendidus]|uniref:hypothetical protein n=1 Tax=Vibrio splendidus TaxID=29497 RepID=UPI00076ADF91|nr:hypothetical protein [Vibrio splendidus]PHX05296.1 hypothetical protein VSPL_30790 [Vibrio splendidus]
MKKLCLLVIPFLSFPVSADWQEAVDLVGETFNISVSKSDFLGKSNNDDLTYTLYGSYNLNDDWRIFGQADTDHFLELGVGYSFILADQIYNEVTTSVGGNDDNVMVYSAGLFSAIGWNDFVFYSNVSSQYIDNRITDFPDLKVRLEKISLDKTIGTFYEVNSWLSASLSYTHEATHYNKIKVHSFKLYREGEYKQYISPGITVNIFGVKPTISYNYYFDDKDPKESSYFDFSLNFDF